MANTLKEIEVLRHKTGGPAAALCKEKRNTAITILERNHVAAVRATSKLERITANAEREIRIATEKQIAISYELVGARRFADRIAMRCKPDESPLDIQTMKVDTLLIDLIRATEELNKLHEFYDKLFA